MAGTRETGPVSVVHVWSRSATERESQVETGGWGGNSGPEEGPIPCMSSMSGVQDKTLDRAPDSRDEGTGSGFRSV